MIFKKSEIYQQKANFKTIEEQTVREKNMNLSIELFKFKNNVLTVSYLCEKCRSIKKWILFMEKRKNDLSSTYNKKEEQDRKDFELI